MVSIRFISELRYGWVELALYLPLAVLIAGLGYAVNYSIVDKPSKEDKSSNQKRSFPTETKWLAVPFLIVVVIQVILVVQPLLFGGRVLALDGLFWGSLCLVMVVSALVVAILGLVHK